MDNLLKERVCLGMTRGSYPHRKKVVRYGTFTSAIDSHTLPYLPTSHTYVVSMFRLRPNDFFHLSTAVMTID